MKHVVLLSGGVDSTVLLAHVLNTEGSGIHALSFDYGQRHRRELWSASQIARYYSATHEVVNLPADVFHGSSLTGGGGETRGAPTVIPGRNVVLLSVAIAIAVREKARCVWFAPHAGDREVYRDCRREFVGAFDAAAGHGYGVGVYAPFLDMTKAQVVARGRQLGVPFDLTWSCYDPQNHDPDAPTSGAPCGVCGACEGRKVAFA